jgi:hypothetical protein
MRDLTLRQELLGATGNRALRMLVNSSLPGAFASSVIQTKIPLQVILAHNRLREKYRRIFLGRGAEKH